MGISGLPYHYDDGHNDHNSYYPTAFTTRIKKLAYVIFRENKTINYHKCMNEIKTSVDNLIDSMTTKYKLSPRTFDDWKDKSNSIANNWKLLKVVIYFK